MKKMAKASLTFVAALLFMSAAGSLQAELKVGDNMPDFTLSASDGKTYKASDFRGKKALVIAWFPRAFTGGCTKECINFRAEGEALKAYDVAYFTASVDPVKKNTEFAKSLNLDYPILSDPDMKLAKALGVLRDGRPFSNRWTYIVSKEGKILHIDKKVNVTNHAKDIAAKLKEHGVAKK